MNRYLLREALTWSVGKHTLRIGGELQHYNASGEINVFGTGTVILVSNLRHARL